MIQIQRNNLEFSKLIENILEKSVKFGCLNKILTKLLGNNLQAQNFLEKDIFQWKQSIAAVSRYNTFIGNCKTQHSCICS